MDYWPARRWRIRYAVKVMHVCELREVDTTKQRHGIWLNTKPMHYLPRWRELPGKRPEE